VVSDIIELLAPGGRFAAFYTSLRRDGDDESILKAESTRLAQALLAHGRAFSSWDFTEDERRF
jgi:hypothetical protein